MIALRGVGKRFASTQKGGGTEALRDVSFNVGAGEFVSLLGPSRETNSPSASEKERSRSASVPPPF